MEYINQNKIFRDIRPMKTSLDFVCWMAGSRYYFEEIHVSSIVHFCLGEYRFSVDYFWKHNVPMVIHLYI